MHFNYMYLIKTIDSWVDQVGNQVDKGVKNSIVCFLILGMSNGGGGGGLKFQNHTCS